MVSRAIHRKSPFQPVQPVQPVRAAVLLLAGLLTWALTFLTGLSWSPAQAAQGALSAYAAAGPAAVVTETGEIADPARERTIPYKLYRPERLSGQHPAVLFSHGLGGSREAAAYLGNHLASHGYLALHIQHPGTDQSLLRNVRGPQEVREALRVALRQLETAADRFKDVPAAIDALAAWNQDGPLAGHIDLERIGMSGHSYGAKTTLVAAGERLGPMALTFREQRIRAAIAYSPNAPWAGRPASEAFAAVTVPILHVTGTEDGNPLARGSDFDPAERTIPFKSIAARPQYLLVLDGADHRVFSGRTGPRGPRPRDEDYWALVKAASLAFWDAHLRDKDSARAFLKSSTLVNHPDTDTYEVKP